MKRCTKCSKAKPLDEFHWRSKSKGQKNSWCKECISKHVKKAWRADEGVRDHKKADQNSRWKRNARFVWDYLTKHPCIVCGEVDPKVLDFDHREQEMKLGVISEMSRKAHSIDTITKEIEKCNVLCANCHRRRTAVQCGWYKWLNE